MPDITVACVLRSGGPYDKEYVERLKQGVDANLSGHRFLCLSDVNVPCERIPLRHGWPGWWSKIELFRLPGPVLFFDLDTVINGDLTEIASYPHRFTMLTDFTRPDRAASGVMAWGGDWSHIYRSFDPDAQYPGHGDGGYIESMVDADRFQELFPGQIVSRKVHRNRKSARVVCYHGTPRPHDTGWTP